MITSRPDCYECPDNGHQWPGTLKGLLQAIEDTAMESARCPGQQFTLNAVRGASAGPVRAYLNGKELR